MLQELQRATQVSQEMTTTCRVEGQGEEVVVLSQGPGKPSRDDPSYLFNAILSVPASGTHFFLFFIFLEPIF